jgi:hypothetical protein
MDAGVAISAIFIFFVLQYPNGGSIGLNTIQTWWGNTVYVNTADGNKTPMISLADGETFGYVFVSCHPPDTGINPASSLLSGPRHGKLLYILANIDACRALCYAVL